MFENLHIENYRGIKNLSLNNLKPINLLLGKNSTGKSTILEAIYINCFPSKVEVIFKCNSARNHNNISSDVFRSFFYKINTKENIKFKVKHHNLHEHSLNIDFKFADIPHNDQLNKSSILTFKSVYKYGLQLETTAIFHNGKITFNSSPNNEGASNSFFLHSSASWIFEINIGFESMIIRKETDKLIKILKFLEPSVKNVFLGDNKLIYLDCGYDSLVPLNYFGNAFISTFALIVAIISFPQSIILIDSLDIIGAEYRDIVWLNLFRLAKEYGNQLFITSANPEVYKTFMITASKANMTDEIRVFKTDKKGEDIVVSSLK